MFNALNRFMSRLDGGDPQQRQQEQGSFGFQVLRNTNLQLAVEPWFRLHCGNQWEANRENPRRMTWVQDSCV